jgi:hypothetical protein
MPDIVPEILIIDNEIIRANRKKIGLKLARRMVRLFEEANHRPPGSHEELMEWWWKEWGWRHCISLVSNHG